jgi:hypothetical protein
MPNTMQGLRLSNTGEYGTWGMSTKQIVDKAKEWNHDNASGNVRKVLYVKNGKIWVGDISRDAWSQLTQKYGNRVYNPTDMTNIMSHHTNNGIDAEPLAAPPTTNNGNNGTTDTTSEQDNAFNTWQTGKNAAFGGWYDRLFGKDGTLGMLDRANVKKKEAFSTGINDQLDQSLRGLARQDAAKGQFYGAGNTAAKTKTLSDAAKTVGAYNAQLEGEHATAEQGAFTDYNTMMQHYLDQALTNKINIDQNEWSRQTELYNRAKNESQLRDAAAAGDWSTFGKIISGAVSGAGVGTAINPGWGTAIGAVLGAAGGLLDEKTMRAIAKALNLPTPDSTPGSSTATGAPTYPSGTPTNSAPQSV